MSRTVRRSKPSVIECCAFCWRCASVVMDGVPLCEDHDEEAWELYWAANVEDTWTEMLTSEMASGKERAQNWMNR